MNDYLENVEFRQLEAFRAIAEAGTFHGAASDTGYSQSVISQHLSNLERNIGLRLIERGRGKRRIELTQAGRVLLRHVEAIEASLGAASADLHQLRTGHAGKIRVGTYQSVSARILPKLLGIYAKQYPDVKVEVFESRDDRESLPMLATGELDFVFTAFPLAPGPFEAVEIMRDPWLLLTQVDSPLTKKKSPLPVSALKDQPLIGFGATGVVQVQLEEFLRGSGLNPNIVFRTNDNVAVSELVASGLGSALMPALATNSQNKKIARIPVDIPTRSIALAWNANREQLPAATTFIKSVQQVCQQLGK